MDKVFFPDPGFLSAYAEGLPFLDFKDGRVYAVYSYLLFFHIFSGSIAGMSGTRSKKESSSPSAFRRERRWESEKPYPLPFSKQLMVNRETPVFSCSCRCDT
mgnify:CR=1 FL=1